MKGDFTRITFRPRKRYTGVRMQQGRVQLDADWNEQVDIQTHLDRTEATDTIGRAGAPKAASGFEIAPTPDEADLTVSPGRFYVDGVLCELEAPDVAIASFPSATKVELERWPDDDSGLATGRWVELSADGVPAELRKIAGADEPTRVLTLDSGVSAFDGPATPRLRPVTTFLTQPDLPEPALTAPAGARTDLVYLDVWEREVDGGRGSVPPRAGAQRRRHGDANPDRLAGSRRGRRHGHELRRRRRLPAPGERGAAHGRRASFVAIGERALPDPARRRLPRAREPALPRRDPQRRTAPARPTSGRATTARPCSPSRSS